MDEEAKRMSRLIDDLLSLSKVEVDEHLSRLRKAINKPDGQTEMPNLIRTVRGSGYALRAPH
jgi:DNA-binding response OmpR family regulator